MMPPCWDISPSLDTLAAYRSTYNFHFCVYMAYSSRPVLPGFFHLVSVWRDIPSGLDDLLLVNGNSRDDLEVNTHAIMISILLRYCYGNW